MARLSINNHCHRAPAAGDPVITDPALDPLPCQRTKTHYDTLSCPRAICPVPRSGEATSSLHVCAAASSHSFERCRRFAADDLKIMHRPRRALHQGGCGCAQCGERRRSKLTKKQIVDGTDLGSDAIDLQPRRRRQAQEDATAVVQVGTFEKKPRRAIFPVSDATKALDTCIACATAPTLTPRSPCR